MQFTVNLTAGQRQRQQTAGRFFLILDTGAAATIEVALMRGTQELERIRTAARGFKARTPEGFTHVELRATVNATAEIIISDGMVDFDFFAGASVQATIAGPLPVPVSNDRGSPGNLLHVAGVSLADAPATAVTNNAPVACGPVAAVVAAADATRRALRFHNLGPDPVAIGAAGITWANRVIVLEPGDVWIEDRAANLAWSAITDAAKAASVTAQGVNA
jgi:hypothetical protein